MNHPHKSRWLLDAALFAGLIAACFVDLTGVELHQWIGLLAGSVALYHLIEHIHWVEAIGQRFFGRIATQARTFFVIDAALLVGFFLTVGTGLVISTWLGLSLVNYAAWLSVHIGATIASLVLTALKIYLHRGWILQVARKWVFVPAPVGVPVQRATAPTAVTRRDFLGMMGVVGAATCLALGQSVESLQEVSGAESEELAAAVTTTATASTRSSTGSNSASSPCTVQCGKRCSFPGHCRRYVDTNNNNRCDLGECS